MLSRLWKRYLDLLEFPALRRFCERYVDWTDRREERRTIARMDAAFPKGCRIEIVRHGCHSIPEGSTGKIVRANYDARDYLIEMDHPTPFVTSDRQTYVCPLALRRKGAD